MEKLTIDDLGYVAELRQRLGLNNPDDTRRDSEIEDMEPFERVRLLAGWYIGSEGWADTFKSWCESQGIYLTIDPEAKGII